MTTISRSAADNPLSIDTATSNKHNTCGFLLPNSGKKSKTIHQSLRCLLLNQALGIGLVINIEKNIPFYTS
jgi:hypothetical protein